MQRKQAIWQRGLIRQWREGRRESRGKTVVRTIVLKGSPRLPIYLRLILKVLLAGYINMPWSWHISLYFSFPLLLSVSFSNIHILVMFRNPACQFPDVWDFQLWYGRMNFTTFLYTFGKNSISFSKSLLTVVSLLIKFLSSAKSTNLEESISKCLTWNQETFTRKKKVFMSGTVLLRGSHSFFIVDYTVITYRK